MRRSTAALVSHLSLFCRDVCGALRITGKEGCTAPVCQPEVTRPRHFHDNACRGHTYPDATCATAAPRLRQGEGDYRMRRDCASSRRVCLAGVMLLMASAAFAHAATPTTIPQLHHGLTLSGAFCGNGDPIRAGVAERTGKQVDIPGSGLQSRDLCSVFPRGPEAIGWSTMMRSAVFFPAVPETCAAEAWSRTFFLVQWRSFCRKQMAFRTGQPRSEGPQKAQRPFPQCDDKQVTSQ